MIQAKLIPSSAPAQLTIVLGAGASRGVSYAGERDIQSPLDADFFDLLQRAKTPPSVSSAVRSVLKSVQSLPYGHWRSMERAFYTLHLRALVRSKLSDEFDPEEPARIVKDFAACVQLLLRLAHGLESCELHEAMFEPLREADTIISFNYDLVPERALKKMADSRRCKFGRWLYGLTNSSRNYDLPLLLKLHGSSNWRVSKGVAESDESTKIEVLTKTWEELDMSPGYRASGEGTRFPIFLPFWDKRIEKQPWLSLWKKAYERLCSTDALIVWGYSLPPTDIKAQQLFEFALGGRQIKLCVIDPSEDTRRRWRELLPEAHFYRFSSVREFFEGQPAWWKARASMIEVDE